ncbi:MAG: cell envelope integrity protein CreD [Chitinophagaceae bacterium]|jgi:inner membrane protein|nr:cell envelope integrity protein CreD [Chitinophagaceae bacterium]
METNQTSTFSTHNHSNAANSILTKLVIVAIITLLMLIPTSLISNLIIERQTTYNANLEKLNNTTIVEKNIASKNYEKSMRTTKYAILVIGLTFAVFFLIELLHKRPVHPIQYVLVGFALAIFYLLVLSIGEYILFDYAYIIASLATISLITLYVKSHFNSWNASAALGGVLTALYGFILVLISLENTALIIGSIALFIVLAVVMYVTRNIDWYHLSANK